MYTVNKEFTCFLIDDDIDDHEIFLKALEAVAPAIHCFTAFNGQEAIDKLRTNEVKPDMIFLDLNMPLMNGMQFLKACQSMGSCRDIPVIILSTSSERETINETKELGARGYITKPDRFSGWTDAIKKKLVEYRTQA